jgi:alkanesulfonate monooxygenase SsuD/methylene tetrahydromethanopterin reductase-like flavin-dependent oxidoreductase (luciferase family)
MSVAIDTTAMRRPLKVGLFLPFAETMADGHTPRWAELEAMARLAEDVGFDSLWVGDHLLAHFTLGTFDCWECLTLLTALAAVTKRVTLGPMVACTSYRNPALIAKIATTLDEISGGRFVLALGAGWHEPEYRAYGFPTFEQRASYFEEAVAIIHGLLREGHIDFVGRYCEARDCELRLRGPQGNRLPLMLAARKPRTRRIAARYADIWNAEWTLPEEIPAQRAVVDAACREAGRDPATLEWTATVRISVPGEWHVPFGFFRGQVTGTPEELAGLLRRYAAEGVTHVQIALGPNTAQGIEAFAPVLELLDRG